MTALASDGRDPQRPLLRWHGGKWLLAPWIISHFPAHRVYVEPFGGAASVLFRKPRAYAEVYNDLDDLVVNLFRVLRDQAKAERLIEALRLTPFARAEFEAVRAPAGDDVELARGLVVRSFMGFGSDAHASSPRSGGAYKSTGFRSNSTRQGTTPATDWASFPDYLPALVDRLRGVMIEHRDASKVMAQYDDRETLHYIDPPYPLGVRAARNGARRRYRHELTDGDHADLLAFLRGLKGMVLLSGYRSPAYDRELAGWRRFERAAHADGAKPRVECLWLNPAAAARAPQPSLFGDAA